MSEYERARYLARTAKAAMLRAYKRDRNVVGGAFGRRIVHGKRTEDLALVVYVMRKVPEQFIPPSSLLPRRVTYGGESLEVDVVETGPFFTFAFTARERPALSGISIGHTNITAGTLGCLVIDNTDRSLCILSNNHVMADGNNAALGDDIVQPGPSDGGTSPADDIATLKRFVTLNPTGNTVDGAIAQVTNPGTDVVNQMKNNLMPVPGPGHPAVGLLFAGSCNRTLMNPIRDVLNQLNISFPAGAGSIVAADVEMNVEKVGRTTEYTTSTITEVDVTVDVKGYPFGTATFDDQIATAWMSEGGDSGSIVCRGGEGGEEDHCGCTSAAAATQVLGVDIGVDAAIEKEFRSKYLSQTLVGRYLLDVYYENEGRLVRRVQDAQNTESEQEYARHLYKKYIDTARMAALQPDRSDIRLTSEHLQDAKEAVGRAKEWMTPEEARAADELFALATEAEGRNVRDVLRMLNDESLLNRVAEILASVPTLRQPESYRWGRGKPGTSK